MGQNDRAQRSTAVPFYSNPWGFARYQGDDVTPSSDNDIGAIAAGDLLNFRPGGTLSATNAIRMTHPYYGGVINCFLNLKFTLAAAEPSRQFRIAIGQFNSDLTAVASYTDPYIAASHKLITGKDSAYTIAAAGTFNQSRLNLAPALYQRGNANYKDDGFVILLVFDAAPGTGTGWDLNKFDCHCTADIGVQLA